LRTNEIFSKLWSNISKNEELKNFIIDRKTVLQVVLVQSKEEPNHYHLLANTHFFFQPGADFIRLTQAVVSTKYLELLKLKLLKENKDIQKLTIFFGGDLNSSPTSSSFKYIANNVVTLDNIKEGKLYFIIV
jgi:mRNA deadenylase 3'-5' endonuclease subunit Ccr4